MKIAYVTTYDSSDVHNWSGSGTYIRSTLESSGFQTEAIGNLKEKWVFFLKLKKAFYAALMKKRYLWEKEPIILRNYASQVEKALAQIDYDVVFCPGTTPITYLQTKKPIVVWLDSIFAGGVNFYPYYSNLCGETLKKGNMTAQLALTKCRLVLFASDWAADSALSNYDVDPKKVKVVPFGANIICNRNIQDISRIVKDKNYNICKLLFVGVDWLRKGGPLALQVAELLNQRGIKTELHVVGCDPKHKLPDFVKLHGFISKDSEEGRKTLDKLFLESHFFILPSRAESYGVVFAEASSFGLPSLATRVGGIPTVIHDGLNGQTFPLDENPEKYCEYIEMLLSSKDKYEQLAMSTFKEYSERLNWETAGKKVYELIEEFCS